ncbi:MAG: peptide-binding protein, partial [Methylocystis sp.]|nr:peptide-binding protein [Methylocystis sp.]
AKKPEGVAVPIALNPKTGLVTVDAMVDGRTYPVVIDAGSGYSWMRGDTVKQWLAPHPEWRRAEGAVGLANYNMLDWAFEKQGTIARIPEIAIGAVRLRNIGVLGTGPILGRFGDGLIGDLFWDNWQKAAPGPVVGWLGGNALKPFKLAIDYPNRMSYWQSRAAPDPHDLDQVGLTLVRRSERYFIGGVVRKASVDAPDRATVDDVEIGDELLAVDGLTVPGADKDSVLSALHGAPDERRTLVIERGGQRRQIEASVTAFD